MRILLILPRNLGDAIIAAGILSSITVRVPEVEWQVWCRPELKSFFQQQPRVTRIFANRFPVGTDKRFGFQAAWELLKNAVRLRRTRFALSIDTTGDFREVALAHLVGARNHISPVWPRHHLYSLIIRNSPRAWISHPIDIPDDATNIYAAYEYLAGSAAEKISHDHIQQSSQLTQVSAPLSHNARKATSRVGIHPFASLPCKLWEDHKWHELAQALIAQGKEIVLFAAPSERERLRAMFQGLVPEDRIITRSLPEFLEVIRTLDILIGLDSFSIHFAHLASTPSVMLNGANDPRLWIPPTGHSITRKADCGVQPCYNKPTCIGKAYEFSCMKKIDVADVINAVNQTLNPTLG